MRVLIVDHYPTSNLRVACFAALRAVAREARIYPTQLSFAALHAEIAELNSLVRSHHLYPPRTRRIPRHSTASEKRGPLC